MAKQLTKQLAYHIETVQDLHYSVYRVSRGFPFQRAGQPVVAIPQFKGLRIFSQAPNNALSSFGTASPTVRIAWPSRGK